MAKERKVADVLADNLAALMSDRRLSEKELERLSGVAQKTTNNIAHRRHDPRLSSIAGLAGALKLATYQLLCPMEDHKFLAVCLAWAQSDDRGREDLRRIAEAILKKHEATGTDTSSATVHRTRDRAG